MREIARRVGAGRLGAMRPLLCEEADRLSGPPRADPPIGEAAFGVFCRAAEVVPPTLAEEPPRRDPAPGTSSPAPGSVYLAALNLRAGAARVRLRLSGALEARCGSEVACVDVLSGVVIELLGRDRHVVTTIERGGLLLLQCGKRLTSLGTQSTSDAAAPPPPVLPPSSPSLLPPLPSMSLVPPPKPTPARPRTPPPLPLTLTPPFPPPPPAVARLITPVMAPPAQSTLASTASLTRPPPLQRQHQSPPPANSPAQRRVGHFWIGLAALLLASLACLKGWRRLRPLDSLFESLFLFGRPASPPGSAHRYAFTPLARDASTDSDFDECLDATTMASAEQHATWQAQTTAHAPGSPLSRSPPSSSLARPPMNGEQCVERPGTRAAAAQSVLRPSPVPVRGGGSTSAKNASPRQASSSSQPLLQRAASRATPHASKAGACLEPAVAAATAGGDSAGGMPSIDSGDESDSGTSAAPMCPSQPRRDGHVGHGGMSLSQGQAPIARRLHTQLHARLSASGLLSDAEPTPPRCGTADCSARAVPQPVADFVRSLSAGADANSEVLYRCLPPSPICSYLLSPSLTFSECTGSERFLQCPARQRPRFAAPLSAEARRAPSRGDPRHVAERRRRLSRLMKRAAAPAVFQRRGKVGYSIQRFLIGIHRFLSADYLGSV